MENLEDHAVGPRVSTVRSVGSITQPPRSGRNKFTLEDDQILWDWVHRTPQKGGGTDGNEIYKQLEETVSKYRVDVSLQHNQSIQNPRHPWQSWRDRWVKHLKGTHPAWISNRASPASSDHAEGSTKSERRRKTSQLKKIVTPRFSEEDARVLLKHGEDIENVHSSNAEVVWEEWTKVHNVSVHRQCSINQ